MSLIFTFLPLPPPLDAKTPYHLELVINTGPRRCNGRLNCKSTSNLQFVRLHPLDGDGGIKQGSSSFELKLYRDPALNRQLTDHTDYNVFVIDENGQDQRVDGLDLHSSSGHYHHRPADSKVAFFRT